MEIDTAALMKEVGRIRILTQKTVDERLAGDYRSVFRGQGMEFDEARPYQPGDDVRLIDWNVTARTGVPYIKRYSEERELTVLFMVDVSGSQAFGTGRSKAAVAAELTALLALTAIRNQDRIGLLLFSDRAVRYIPPRKGRRARIRLGPPAPPGRRLSRLGLPRQRLREAPAGLRPPSRRHRLHRHRPRRGNPPQRRPD